MERTKKIGKRGVVLLVLLIVGAVVTSGTMITYYMQTTSSVGVGRLWEVKTNTTGTYTSYEAMEEVDLSYDITDIVGGDSDSFTFTIKLSGHSNADKKVYFYITEANLTEGVNLTILHGSTEILDGEYYEFSPGDEIEFTYVVSVDEFTPEGSYSVALELLKN